MSDFAVEFDNVTKKFGDNVLFEHFNFNIRKNEVVSIIGPSGSGKSTLLRILMTLESIDAGMVRVQGESLWHMQKNGAWLPADERHLRKCRGHMGMVFQHFNLFPHMTVLRNITEAPIHVLGQSKEEARANGMELLRTVGLADKADAYPSRLSGGQKQRVGIARALAMKPSILLLDEITSALDPELVDEVLEVIRKLAAEDAYTMMLVTHEMYFAREISDRVCFFDAGQIVEEGPPEQIFNAPNHERTRAFLNSFLNI
ncbi:MAG: ectoine/hydroxyectoine ABC transporter ATP-binding protein EhuA [Oceanospirillaceae bacterium]|nr:ectoine/hydroxyectoine ABC transporter ATP-binding protein EhuA [Oceanospirillaceae bacterium]